VGEDAEFICLNADEQIPLKEGSVSTIVSMDALQFIDKKEPVAKEMIRILQANGLIVFIHLHNLNVQCPAFGKPLTPEGYASLFPGFGAKYFDEKTLVDHVLKRAGLDISAGNTPEKVKDAEAISIVLTKDHAFFKKYPPYDVLSNVKAPDKIMLNPIFMRVGDEYLLRFPSERYEVEYWMAKDIFPAKVKAGASEKELRERFIFIPAPENYMNKGERLYRFRLWR
jgi:SAM-dependent methyltransferase